MGYLGWRLMPRRLSPTLREALERFIREERPDLDLQSAIEYLLTEQLRGIGLMEPGPSNGMENVRANTAAAPEYDEITVRLTPETITRGAKALMSLSYEWDWTIHREEYEDRFTELMSRLKKGNPT